MHYLGFHGRGIDCNENKYREIYIIQYVMLDQGQRLLYCYAVVIIILNYPKI